LRREAFEYVSDSINECLKRSRRGLALAKFFLGLWRSFHISHCELDHERAIADILLTPVDLGKDMVFIERLELQSHPLIHDSPLQTLRLSIFHQSSIKVGLVYTHALTHALRG
jgi:hypothetical protein